jgi:NhaA family Na+:H+ antiporter
MAKPLTLAFLRTEAGAGAVLAIAALAGLAMANSHWAPTYHAFIAAQVPFRLGPFADTRSVADWTRDGLMAAVFLVVGLEAKYEILRGEFSSPRRMGAPLMAAAGGLVVPALAYLAINLVGPHGRPGAWPAATPTDVAFALAALALFGRRLPASLRLFILCVAVAGDLGAVILIGVLFHGPLHSAPLTGAAVVLAILAGLSRWRRAPRLFYAAGFVLVWAFTLKSGLNTCVAGLACALTTPIDPRRADQESVLTTFMDGMHPYVAYAILPLFVFTTTGISLRGLAPDALGAPAPLGLLVGLVLAKPLGVFGGALLSVTFKVGRRPLGVSWAELFGVACLCGAGFTVSLFVADLAFAPGALAAVRMAVMLGSVASALLGGLILSRAQASRLERGGEEEG